MLPLILALTVGIFFAAGHAIGWFGSLAAAVALVLAGNVVLDRVFDKGMGWAFGRPDDGSAGKSLGRSLGGIAVSLAILAWFGLGRSDGAARPRLEGKPVRLTVAGAPVEIAGATGIFSRFLGDTHRLEISAARDGDTVLSFGFMCKQAQPSELQGQALRSDYSQDNPDGTMVGESWNFFYAKGRYYQAHDVSLTVTRVGEKELSVKVEGTYLEFANDRPYADEEKGVLAKGNPVQVAGAFTVPFEVEKEE